MNTITFAEGSMAGRAKGYHANYIASDICGQEAPTIPVTLDCSLCTLGWPMYGGTVGIRIYGPRCNGNDQPPVDSYWIPSQGGMGLLAGFRCDNPGYDLEPDPSSWVFFNNNILGARTPSAVNDENYCQNYYRFRGRISATNANGSPQIILSDMYMDVLSPERVWTTYFQVPTQQLAEDANSDTTPYRQRRYNSDYIAVTPALIGGEGDPISFVKLSVVLMPFKYGCGGNNTNIDPMCGMFRDGAWHTCFRAHVQNDIADGYNAVVGSFYQLGLDPKPCGANNATDPYCGCDVIQRNQFGVFFAEKNNKPQFVQDYAQIGVPGENDAYAVQQIQTDGSGLVVKSINGGPLYLGYKNLNGTWEVAPLGAPAQAHSPTVYFVQFTSVKVWLYTLRFPSPSILPGECGGDDPPRLAQMLPPEIESVAISEPTTPRKTPPEVLKMIQRISIPCVNIGEYLEDIQSCGCNKLNVLRSCSLHGKCRVRGLLKSNDEQECMNCEDYQPKGE